MSQRPSDGAATAHVVDGKSIYLRALTQADVTDRYCAWLNDAEVNRYLETRFDTQTLERVRAYVAEQSASPTAVLFGIMRKADQLHLGNLRIGAIDRHHQTGTIALVIGEKEAWGRGYGTEAIRLATDYALGSLGLRKVTARCYATNVASIRAFERAGWRHEGRQVSQFISEGVAIDGVWLGYAATDEAAR